jgi:hypothetical protein
MKKLVYTLLFAPLLFLNAQKIGEYAVAKPHIDFPKNSSGVDLMIGEGGFGLGGFYKYALSNTFSAFIDISIAETKHEREIERYDIFGYPLPVFGKKNRVFLFPLNIGGQYRLFYESLTDNLRPYISAGIGPTMLVTTPAEIEFFKSFKQAKAIFGLGGYIGFGANFGLNPSNLTGINVRYYFVQLFNDGIEQYYDEYKKNFQQVSLTINIGLMF